jgi:hypothetical protein
MKMPNGYRVAGALAFLVVFVWAIKALMYPNGLTGPSPFDPGQRWGGGATDKTSDPTDVLKDQKFRAAHPDFVPAVQKLIVASGYECPALTELWNRGESQYGLKLEALCGPNDGSGNSYPKLHYAAYPKQFKVNPCSEFGAFQNDCS